MTLLVSDIAAYLKQRLGGETSMSTVSLCNQAGRHLTSMHEWMWLSRPTAPLTLVANQEFVKLPADFGHVIAAQGALITGGLRFCTLEEIIEWRSLGITSSWTGYLHAAISYKASVVTGALEPRLEVYPTPTASDSTTYRLSYRAMWADVPDDRLALPIPNWCELLFLEIVAAVAQGIEEHDLAGISARVSLLRGSDVFVSAVLFDGNRVSNLGQMSGGWYPAADGYDWSLYPASISGPGV